MLASENFAITSHHFKKSIYTPYNGEDLALQLATSSSSDAASTPTPTSIDASVEFDSSIKMLNIASNTSTSSSNNNNNNNNHIGCNGLSSFVASHPAAEFEGFIRACVDEIIQLAVFQGTNRSSKVVEWHEPAELRQLFDFELRDKGESQDKLRQLLRETIRFSVKTGHPYFINQLYSGVDPYALVGQWLTDALNPSVYTYEVAPVFTLMEEQVLAEMRRIVGFPDNGHGDGIFCPGGSIANGYAISCARYKYAPESKVSITSWRRPNHLTLLFVFASHSLFVVHCLLLLPFEAKQSGSELHAS